MGNTHASNNIQSNNEIITKKHKIILVGNCGDGKTSLISRFVYDKFESSTCITLEKQQNNKEILIDNTNHILEIWDTMGNERFRTLTSSFYRNTEGIIIVSDITDTNQLNNINYWYCDSTRGFNFDIPVIIAGNKCDLEDNRNTNYEDIVKYAEENNLKYIETSAKDDINVYLLFNTLLYKIEDIIPPNKISRAKSARK